MKNAKTRLSTWLLVAGLVSVGLAGGQGWSAVDATPGEKPSLSVMNLVAVVDGPGRIELTWDRSVGDTVSGFRILRGAGPGGGLYPVGVIPASPAPRQRFVDRIPGNTGYVFAYRVVALGAQDRPLGVSERVEIEPPDHRPPARPTITSAVPVPGKIRLAWSRPSERDLAGFNVYRAGGGEDERKLNGNLLAEARYEDVSIVGGRPYRYAVTAVDRWGNESRRSKTVTVRGLVALEPAVVEKLSWSEAADGKRVLAWAPIESSDVRGYFVYRSDDPDKGFVNVSGLLKEPRYVDPPGAVGAHWYRVETVYRNGVVSEPSETLPGREKP